MTINPNPTPRGPGPKSCDESNECGHSRETKSLTEQLREAQDTLDSIGKLFRALRNQIDCMTDSARN